MKIPENYKSLTTLDISNNALIKLPFWIIECKKLENLNCSGNNITQIDNLPESLKVLNCSNNKIIQLDNLPAKIEILYCSIL